ncbi:NAD-dependent epimerase/dehydratase family protein [Cellulomonas sp. B6]|uniref:NAD-dependent epimerase/dehydratase family protein n=1 Tax=Cellulomonas sp. B6 TaxID=1295626 RepID=UPI00073AFC29|nr:NAD-dependent epimerase/dehydratase family protein [Cellulomonas sp. B6]KSW30015.1 hypothetical protein ATM99_05095 [Cellulomonas sp. B6]
MSAAPTAVLGASGQVGRLVLDALVAAGHEAVAVGRTAPRDVPDGVTVRVVPSYDGVALADALTGCGAVVATLGLPYRSAVWTAQWPTLVAAVTAACRGTGLPLTFLDNVYVYGDAREPLRETTPLRPCSRKGEARLAGWHVLAAHADAGHDVVVCRAADFLGPGASLGIVPWPAVVAAAGAGRPALPWLGDPDAPHSFALTTEVAAALVQVAHDPSMRTDTVLHLPAVEPTTGRALADALGRVRTDGRTVRLRALRSPVVRAAALVNGAAREQAEMMYQVEHEQLVDDSVVRALGWSAPRTTVADVAALAHARAERDARVGG